MCVFVYLCVCVCVCACVRACVPACLRACVPACLRACVPACGVYMGNIIALDVIVRFQRVADGIFQIANIGPNLMKQLNTIGSQ